MQTIRIWWADSRGKVIVLLAFLWAIILVRQFQWMYVSAVVGSLIATIGFDLALGKLRFGTWKFSLSSVVTGLLVGMIMDPLGGLLPVVSASFVAVISKQYLRKPQGKHVFNPASVGIVLSSLMFNRPVAWWAVAWGWIPAVIIGVFMFFVLKRLRRLWISVTFLIIYMLSLAPTAGWIGSLQLTLEGTIFLFAFVMLIEPVTSPAMGTWKYGWGILVGVLVVVQNLLGQSVTDPLLLGLLGANTIFFFLSKRKPLTL